MKPKEYFFHFDLARTAAIIGVVAIHVFYPIYSRPDFLGGGSWWMAYGINALSRIAVPFFLMVSGCLLLNKKPKNQTKDTLNRIVFRLGIPMIFWAIIYFWWENHYYGRLIFLDQAIRIFFTGSFFHLYFLVILFGLYLLLPLWRNFNNQANDSQKKTAILMAFILGVILYALQFFIYKEKTIFNFLSLWIPYLGYFLAGPYVLALPKTSKKTITAALVFCLTVMATIIFGYFNLKLFSLNKLFFWGMGGSEYATNWLSPNIILMSQSGFFLITKVKIQNKIISKIIQSIARASFGIYLIHMIVINILDKYFGLYLDFQNKKLWLYGMEKMTAVVLLSWLIASFIRKIPLIRILIGEKSSRF